MLNVSDNLRRALDTQPEEIADDMKAFVEGVAMTESELLNTMERYGITKVEPEVGEKFDHKFHQAMFEVPTEEHAPGSVVQVVAPGYVIKDRLLRPAMVGVAKGQAKAVDTEA
jgi:molecular chaperone GrpE